MDEPGALHPPGVRFTLFFYSPPSPPLPLHFSFFSLLFAFYVPFSEGRIPLSCPRPFPDTFPSLRGRAAHLGFVIIY